MSEYRSLGIEIDSDRTVFSIADGDEHRRYSIPTCLAVTSEGIEIGHSIDRETAQEVFGRSLNTARDEDITAEKLPLAAFFDRAVSEARSQIPRVNVDEVAFESVSIGVPGGSSPEVVDAVEAAAVEAGLPAPSIYRRPTQTVVQDLETSDSMSLVLGLSITAEEASFAIYESKDDGLVEVRGRSSRQNLGSRSLSRSLADFLLKQVGQERDGTVEVSEASVSGFAEVIRQSARENQRALLEGARLPVEYELSDGAALTAGEHTLADSIHVDDVLEYGDRLSALEEYTNAVIETLEDLLSATGVEPDDINRFVAYGDGYVTDVIEETVFGIIGAETPSTIYGTNEAGADALVDGAGPESYDSSETLPYLIQVQGAGPDGIQSEPVTPVLQSPDGPHQFTLAVVGDTQQQGRFGIEFVLPHSEQIAKRFDVAIHGLPLTDSNDPVNLEFELVVNEAVPQGPEDIEVDILDSRLKDCIENEISDPESVEGDPSWEVPWLGLAVDGDIPLIKLSETEKTYLKVRDRISEVHENLSEDDIAGVVHKTRSDLWEWAAVKERELSPSAIQSILRELDQRFERQGIEFYVPELGTISKHGRHQVRKQEPSYEEEGTIIEVLKPGLEIEGRVAEPAIVTISSGNSPTVDEPEDVDETEAVDESEEDVTESTSTHSESADSHNESDEADDETSTHS